MLSFIGLITLPANAEGWLCTADSVVGFTYEKTVAKWKPTVPDWIKGDTFVVRRPSPKDHIQLPSAVWLVQPVGTRLPVKAIDCESDFGKNDHIVCTDEYQEFWFRRNTLTFQWIRKGAFDLPADMLNSNNKAWMQQLEGSMQMGSCVET